jgi:hypothetical protein
MAIKCGKGTPCGGACIRAGAKCKKSLNPGASEALDNVKKKIGLGVKIRNAQRKGDVSEEARLRVQREALSNKAAAKPKSVAPEEQAQLTPKAKLQAQVAAAKEKGRKQAEEQLKNQLVPQPEPLSKPDPLYGAWGTEELKKFRAGFKDGNPGLERAKNQIDAELARRKNPPAPAKGKEEPVQGKLFSSPRDKGTAATGNTRWARGDAKDFDSSMRGEPLRREGDKKFDKWEETSGSGSKKLGEGSFGTVMVDSKRTYAVKRGDVSDTEARLIQKLGDADLGPKLIAADIDGPGLSSNPGVDIRRGRVAMTVVPGNPIGYKDPAYTISGVKVADAYWKARAELHRMGIAHNDMHVDNVLIDRVGKGRFVDMGLAQDSPKAALSEALGAFSGGRGKGDWQVREYAGTGGGLLPRGTGPRATPEGRKRLRENAPLLHRVTDNKNELQYQMKRDGFSKEEIDTVIDHGIRKKPSAYNNGVWSKMTDEQAMGYINMLYEGV